MRYELTTKQIMDCDTFEKKIYLPTTIAEIVTRDAIKSQDQARGIEKTPRIHISKNFENGIYTTIYKNKGREIKYSEECLESGALKCYLEIEPALLEYTPYRYLVLC